MKIPRELMERMLRAGRAEQHNAKRCSPDESILEWSDRVSRNVIRAILREYSKPLTCGVIPPAPPKSKVKRAAQAVILALALLLPAHAATFCDLACLSEGASNQSLCAPLAQHIDVDWANSLLTVTYDANNGTYISGVQTDAVAWSGIIWSNGDSEQFAAPEPEWIRVRVMGVGGPGRYADFACSGCEAAPEPASLALVGAGLAAACLIKRRS